MNALTSFNERLWLGAVLRQVEKVPAGEKLRVGDMARSLSLSQADVITSIETLIAEGRLDAKTLRPAVPVTVIAVGRKARPYCQQPNDCPAPSRGPCRICHRRPAEADRPQADAPPRRVPLGDRRFTENKQSPVMPLPATPPASDSLRTQLAGGTLTRRPALTEGGALADRLIQLIDAHDLSKTRVSQHLFGMKGGVESLRRRKLKGRTVAKIEAFLADPPIDQFRRKREFEQPQPGSKRAAARRMRDLTQAPETPLMDADDRRRLGAARHSAAIQRGREQAAAQLVDDGVDPSTQNSQVANQMREVMRRRAEEARQGDPVEQAKLALRKRGRVVCDANVLGGKQNRFMVSGQRDADTGKPLQLKADDLIDLAWRVNPTAMQQLTGRASR